jgi:hypothetical protein
VNCIVIALTKRGKRKVTNSFALYSFVLRALTVYLVWL